MTRIDIELVKRGIFETRNKAQNEIKNKIVYCNNVCITKPAFDVTDNNLIAGIVTEYGIARAPYNESLKEIFEKKNKGVKF